MLLAKIKFGMVAELASCRKLDGGGESSCFVSHHQSKRANAFFLLSFSPSKTFIYLGLASAEELQYWRQYKTDFERF